MQQLLIKLGKAWSVMKRDGFVRMVQRVVPTLGVYVKPLGTGDVLYISGGVGDSARYRTTHVAEEVNLHSDLIAKATTQDYPWIMNAVDNFSVFVLHRTTETPASRKFIDAVKAQNKTIIFETDDLIHDADALKTLDYLDHMTALEKKQYEKPVGLEVLEDPYVRYATTSTNYLAQNLRHYGKEVFVVPNKLSAKDVALAREVVQKQTALRNSQKVRIGYFSGTISHNKDFATVESVLVKVMEKFAHVELYLVGPLDISSSFNHVSDQITREKFLGSKREYFEAIASCDIAIAPLEIGNPFCEGKSELKFFEAGILNVPVVTSATQTYREAIENGVDGFIAGNDEQWEDVLTELIVDTNKREQVAQQAHKTSHERYSNEHAVSQSYLTFLQKHVQ